MAFLGTLTLILIVTTLVGHFSARIGIPAVIGQLVIGVVLGPAVLNWVQPSHFIHIFSEIGVIILMFMAGIESDLQLLKKYLRPSVIVAILGVVVPILSTMLVGKAFGISGKENIFIAVIFAATSVSISVAVLKELNVLSGKAGSTILGAAVVDDVLAVVILSIMVSLMGTGAGGGSSNLVVTFIEQILFFVAIYFVVRFIAPYLAKLGEKLFMPVGVTLVSVILCFGMAYVADLIGLSSVVGAFFAGIAVAQTSAKKEVDQHIEPIGYAIFIPVFFVSIGLNMTLAGMRHDLLLIVVLTVVATLSKLVGAGFGAYISKFDMRTSYMVGGWDGLPGEMALIIAQIGYQAKLLSTDYYSAIVTAIILTTLIAPFLIKSAKGKELEIN